MQTGIVLTVNATPAVNVVMSLGELSEQVTVTANAAMVETRSTGVGQLIENQRVLELPLNGRQVTDLLLLSPGVTDQHDRRLCLEPQLSDGADLGGGRLAGQHGLHHGRRQPQRPRHELQPAGAVPRRAAGVQDRDERARRRATATTPPPSSTSSPSRGPTSIHGSVFEFVRDGRFNAKNAFALSKDSLRRNQFGGAVGGPIAENRIFFFGGYQGTDIKTDPSTLQAFVPTADMLRGDFTAVASPACNAGRQIALRAPFVNNQVSPSQFDPVALQYLEFIPVSTDPCGRYQYGYPDAEHRPPDRRARRLPAERAGTRSTAATWTSTTSCRTTSTARTR